MRFGHGVTNLALKNCLLTKYYIDRLGGNTQSGSPHLDRHERAFRCTFTVSQKFT